MKIISEDILKLLNDVKIQRSKQLIFENVYFSEIFNHLITYCFANVLTGKTVKLSGSDIKNKLNPHWKYFDEFNISKSLVISSNIDLIKQFINLTERELSDIKTRLKNSHGIFCSDFVNDKNTGLIVIDENINSISKLEDILTHELIHYFQWNINKHIKCKLKYQTNINNSELTEISKCLNISENIVLTLIESCSDGIELETYINRIYYCLKDFCEENNIKFTRLFLSYFCEIFKNKKFETFTQYFNDIKHRLAEYDIHLIYLLKTDEIIYLMLLGYFKRGYNTFKTHIFSYFDKENK